MKMKIERTQRTARPAPLRDARRWFIATEGERTEGNYFQGLQDQGVLSRTRISLIILPTREGRSAPTQVLDRLKVHLSRPEVELRPMDQVWLVLDTDRWTRGGHAKGFSTVLAASHRLGYALAVSNPCFEVWLILHYTNDVDDLPDAGSCADRFQKLQPGYTKARLDVSRFSSEQIRCAIERARSLDLRPEHRIPNPPGTRVYRLMEQLLNASVGSDASAS